MKNANSTNPQGADTAPKDMGFTPWERLKTKRISYPALLLLLAAAAVEYVILSQGWKYQHFVCLPQGMAVYEMGVAMLPANQMLEKAAVEETKMAHLNGELAAIEQKRAEREKKLA